MRYSGGEHRSCQEGANNVLGVNRRAALPTAYGPVVFCVHARGFPMKYVSSYLDRPGAE